MLALTEQQQSFFVGIRSTFYRIAMIAGQGLLVILAGFLESYMSVQPAEFKAIAKPDKFFQDTIQLDSVGVKPLGGNLRLIAKPTVIEIGTKPITQESVNFYSSFAKRFNIMNGFVQEELPPPDSKVSNELVGNVGIVKFYLSNQPDEGDEYFVKLDFSEGSTGINVIEGNTFKFTSKNWDKPAFAVIQIDPTLQRNVEATFKIQSDKIPLAWVFTISVVAVLFLLFFFYHKFILPHPPSDKSVSTFHQTNASKEFFRTFIRFFEKDKILIIIAFLLFYRFGESQLVKMASPFMLDPRSAGGLGLSTIDIGFIYGTIGMIALIVGGILGGFVISKSGLKTWLWWMLIAINLPNLVYVYMSYLQPNDIYIVYICVAVEQFGYGFGFTAYLMYMIYVSEGEYKTSHYALATGFMALGMMIPGMFSGMIQESIGYQHFFVWVVIATIPSFVIAKFIPLDASFGKKKNNQ